MDPSHTVTENSSGASCQLAPAETIASTPPGFPACDHRKEFSCDECGELVCVCGLDTSGRLHACEASLADVLSELREVRSELAELRSELGPVLRLVAQVQALPRVAKQLGKLSD